MTLLRTLSLLPALSLSATELLLEPSGGKAILIDTNLVTKRSSGALTPSDPPKVSADGDEDEITQVRLLLNQPQVDHEEADESYSYPGKFPL